LYNVSIDIVAVFDDDDDDDDDDGVVVLTDIDVIGDGGDIGVIGDDKIVVCFDDSNDVRSVVECDWSIGIDRCIEGL